MSARSILTNFQFFFISREQMIRPWSDTNHFSCNFDEKFLFIIQWSKGKSSIFNSINIFRCAPNISDPPEHFSISVLAGAVGCFTFFLFSCKRVPHFFVHSSPKWANNGWDFNSDTEEKTRYGSFLLLFFPRGEFFLLSKSPFKVDFDGVIKKSCIGCLKEKKFQDALNNRVPVDSMFWAVISVVTLNY